MIKRGNIHQVDFETYDITPQFIKIFDRAINYSAGARYLCEYEDPDYNFDLFVMANSHEEVEACLEWHKSVYGHYKFIEIKDSDPWESILSLYQNALKPGSLREAMYLKGILTPKQYLAFHDYP